MQTVFTYQLKLTIINKITFLIWLKPDTVSDLGQMTVCNFLPLNYEYLTAYYGSGWDYIYSPWSSCRRGRRGREKEEEAWFVFFIIKKSFH